MCLCCHVSKILDNKHPETDSNILENRRSQFHTYSLVYCAATVFEALRYKPEGRGFDSRWLIRSFHRHNPSGHTMVLGSTQPLIRGGADKFLARPGRKQATATKLGIYSTYSPRSSIYFLDRCSNFCKPRKKM